MRVIWGASMLLRPPEIEAGDVLAYQALKD
jgi:hypothetical protein